MATASTDLPGWTSHFEEIGTFLEELERQYGFCNRGYTEYALSRLELCIQTSLTLQGTIVTRIQNTSEEVQDICDSLSELVDSLRRIRLKWNEYQDILDSGVSLTDIAYRAPILQSGGRGRPSFDVSKEQLEYLASMQFTWSEIAALIGVSRSTVYR